jgi:ankyrin repeat protein
VLLAKGADVKAKDDGAVTPLHCASWRGARELVTLLVLKGAEVNAKDNHDDTPLRQAAENRHEDVAELLLAKGAQLDFFTAIMLGKTDQVTVLLKKSPTLVSAREHDDATALHLAVSFQRANIVKFLLDNKADVNAKSKKGWTPLHFVALTGDKEIAELLLSRGADVNSKDEDGETPLSMAESFLGGQKEIGDLLRKHGAHK